MAPEASANVRWEPRNVKRRLQASASGAQHREAQGDVKEGQNCAVAAATPRAISAQDVGLKPREEVAGPPALLILPVAFGTAASAKRPTMGAAAPAEGQGLRRRIRGLGGRRTDHADVHVAVQEGVAAEDGMHLPHHRLPHPMGQLRRDWRAERAYGDLGHQRQGVHQGTPHRRLPPQRVASLAGPRPLVAALALDRVQNGEQTGIRTLLQGRRARAGRPGGEGRCRERGLQTGAAVQVQLRCRCLPGHPWTPLAGARRGADRVQPRPRQRRLAVVSNLSLEVDKAAAVPARRQLAAPAPEQWGLAEERAGAGAARGRAPAVLQPSRQRQRNIYRGGCSSDGGLQFHQLRRARPTTSAAASLVEPAQASRCAGSAGGP
mmetsp:Transcript_110689/g.352525  ORF Transcript_110689/g.352525 Transcript_110689/m.352525 type:complete len:378 (-) Transcript_110689:372-1505(-)